MELYDVFDRIRDIEVHFLIFKDRNFLGKH